MTIFFPNEYLSTNTFHISIANICYLSLQGIIIIMLSLHMLGLMNRIITSLETAYKSAALVNPQLCQFNSALMNRWLIT